MVEIDVATLGVALAITFGTLTVVQILWLIWQQPTLEARAFDPKEEGPVVGLPGVRTTKFVHGRVVNRPSRFVRRNAATGCRVSLEFVDVATGNVVGRFVAKWARRAEPYLVDLSTGVPSHLVLADWVGVDQETIGASSEGLAFDVAKKFDGDPGFYAHTRESYPDFKNPKTRMTSVRCEVRVTVNADNGRTSARFILMNPSTKAGDFELRRQS